MTTDAAGKVSDPHGEEPTAVGVSNHEATGEVMKNRDEIAQALAAASSDQPSYQVVSRYPASGRLGMPGAYRGLLTRVHSNAVIEEGTERVDSGLVNRMLSEGMRSLTSAKNDNAAWATFFSPSDVVGIKVNCSGAPNIMSSPEVVGGIVGNLINVGLKPDQIYIYERFLEGTLEAQEHLARTVHDLFLNRSTNNFAVPTPVQYGSGSQGLQAKS